MRFAYDSGFVLDGLPAKYPFGWFPFVIGESRLFEDLGGKSKLEVPGSGGVGGNLFRGLPAKVKDSGVAGCGPYDPADVLL